MAVAQAEVAFNGKITVGPAASTVTTELSLNEVENLAETGSGNWVVPFRMMDQIQNSLTIDNNSLRFNFGSFSFAVWS